MALFDNLIKDVRTRFNLGSKAGPLIQELIGLIGGQPNGVAKFLGRFRSAGLALEVASWMGKTDGAALSAQQVEQALGPSVADVAGRLGLNRSVAGAALGYALPKVIGVLTPGGVVPTIIPASAASFLDAPLPPPPPSASSVDAFLARRELESSGGARPLFGGDILRRWLAPAAVALIAIGLLGYLLTDRTGARERDRFTAAAPNAPSVAPRLALINENGLIIYSGAVRDGATRDLIIASLKKAFGPDKVSGEIIIDRRAYPAVWAYNLKRALDDFKTPGVQALFEGQNVSVGGVGLDSDRETIVSSLKSALGTYYVFGSLAEVSAAKPSALATLKPGFSAQDLVGALNRSSLGFAANSAELPSGARPLLRQAAILLRRLPPGTLVQIGAYADDGADAAPSAQMQLAQQRANVVRQALVEGGVDPAMVKAKGLGGAEGRTIEGRSSDQAVGRAPMEGRIQFATIR
jgi:uncharacterized protein YidB (DUF937 family)/outer membrane protein OmpA-like peptidoglycan-associated protein